MVAPFDWMGNVDVLLDTEPTTIGMVEAMGAFARLIFFDRRGTGLSSGDVPPNLETVVADCRVVLDELAIDRPVVFGFKAGGSAGALLAATHPERVRSMIRYNPAARSTWAHDYPWGVGPEYVERSERAILEHWGTAEYGPAMNAAERLPSGTSGHLADDPDELLGMLSRHTATPNIALQMQRNWYETDVRAILPSITAPMLSSRMVPITRRRSTSPRSSPMRTSITVTSDRDRPVPSDARAYSTRSASGSGRRPRSMTSIRSCRRAVHRHRRLDGDAGGTRRSRVAATRRTAPRDRACGAGSLERARERHGGRRLLRDLRRACQGDPLCVGGRRSRP